MENTDLCDRLAAQIGNQLAGRDAGFREEGGSQASILVAWMGIAMIETKAMSILGCIRLTCSRGHTHQTHCHHHSHVPLCLVRALVKLTIWGDCCVALGLRVPYCYAQDQG